MDCRIIKELKSETDALRTAYQSTKRKNDATLRIKLKTVFAKAEQRFFQAQIGEKTAHALFAEAIRYCLSNGPKSTRELGERIKVLLPDLCDDTRDLVINGERFGKAWKHGLRNAQVFLRRKGAIYLKGNLWHIA